MTQDVRIKTVSSISDIPVDDWNTLSGAKKEGGSKYNPFLSHAFLSALEDSLSVTPRAGWQSHHMAIESESGKLLAAMPLYAKGHSQGEYVFDHAWADAFQRAGGNYYPKLLSAIPFTPATGQRLLVAEGEQALPLKSALAAGLKEETERLGLSSAHINFLVADDVPILEEEGYLHRIDQQFHFVNEGYADHEAFLETLASRKRKALRKERRAALENGITIDWLTGSDLTEDIWDQFFTFYMDTGSRKWGRPYLTRAFYSMIGVRMADDILLVMARRDGRYIAGAINFIGSDTLFGRHWGCIEDHPFLHFEVCYHQAIDFALAHKLKTVEAGAQGEHKLARGYLPVTTHSMHYFTHPGLHNAVADYLQQERDAVSADGEYLREHSPFRKIET
ncbi:GNAT family N-acetyltransferase [Rhizobium sp. L1K21]|uniref:GNAT family N-acetyltransferase n=1 Tax=Rhizobium sp. L1K21 TaxID=2954933 RepID=UPI0020928480|nr:GNAT family N-acetyltransferase [Rhizobium sp. L1K21]MCO6185982.1 GNAT family N-acetyltransferase [Rhizobium sp. L1K21]